MPESHCSSPPSFVCLAAYYSAPNSGGWRERESCASNNYDSKTTFTSGAPFCSEEWLAVVQSPVQQLTRISLVPKTDSFIHGPLERFHSASEVVSFSKLWSTWILIVNWKCVLLPIVNCGSHHNQSTLVPIWLKFATSSSAHLCMYVCLYRLLVSGGLMMISMMMMVMMMVLWQWESLSFQVPLEVLTIYSSIERSPHHHHHRHNHGKHPIRPTDPDKLGLLSSGESSRSTFYIVWRMGRIANLSANDLFLEWFILR